jgi:cullin-4
MIEETLKLKRFTDKSVAALFTSSKPKHPQTTNAEEMEVDEIAAEKDDDEEQKEEKEDEDEQGDEIIVAGPVRNMQLELQDAIRTGFKAGMGSRQNAPAEWIGKSSLFLRELI